MEIIHEIVNPIRESYIFSTWEIYCWLQRQFYPENICPHCGGYHPRTILPGTFRRGRKSRWKEECGGIEFEVTAERAR